MADRQRGTETMPKDWSLSETIYEDALPGQREAQARDVSRRMGLTIIGFLQAHPDQRFTFRYRVSKSNRDNCVGDVGRRWDNVIEHRYHLVDVEVVETQPYVQKWPVNYYEDLSRLALSHSVFEEIGRRVRGKWLRIKSALRRQ